MSTSAACAVANSLRIMQTSLIATVTRLIGAAWHFDKVKDDINNQVRKLENLEIDFPQGVGESPPLLLLGLRSNQIRSNFKKIQYISKVRFV